MRTISVLAILEDEERWVEMSEGDSIEDLVRALQRLPDAHLVTLAGRPMPITSTLADGEGYRLIRVASGG